MFTSAAPEEDARPAEPSLLTQQLVSDYLLWFSTLHKCKCTQRRKL